MDLHGKCIIVTGATGGIGSALCAGLVEAGATVVAVGRTEETLQRLAAAYSFGRVVPVVADLASESGRAVLLARAHEMHPAPSVLVLAHAQSHFGLLQDQRPADLAALVHLNLTVPMLLVQALLPAFMRQPDAAMVAVGSTFGSIGFAGFAGYSASKFGLRGLFEALAREHAGTRVRFQYLSPRATATTFNPAAVDALNAELGTAVDRAEDVAAALLQSIVRGDARRQLGWPEKLFARLNGLLPELVDRALRKQLHLIRRHARPSGAATSQEFSHEPQLP
ncbi:MULTISPECIES: SDR family oxidoreductase [Xanthomonas]|uniref:SDR family oxidoreductase n=1 Tax=Xanthomonas TaxID=338 RepID=UPI0006E5903F|nr:MULTISPECIES: SDR family oxidoreductase [Xanthomonas]MBO9793597.1 SDR family oxidoreductase [Xanthomonas phaseoli pv. dieffenbachiae]MBO9849068.1 SDR family oxidoreductase [Xanthomonas phaseoli pv. dieffenbachiae]MBV6671275.1 SDR family oxidoreductase [Xanthomonas euvesicatoria pv. alangii]MBV6774978.1 SDR family oxidoreductase [Xanthomonas campestris pv. carissae]MBV6802380.1 SDR family oxidoreductase [Xanthomonas campestris pv. lawsoniae]